MQGLILLIFLTVSFADFATTSPAVPGLLKFLPELLSGVIVLLVLFEGLRKGFSLVSPKYWAVFGVTLLIIACGILTNSVGSGPTLAGMRLYLRAAPMFLIPAVFTFTEKQLQQQLKLLVAIGLVQLPVAIYQRWVIYSAGRFSGDDVRGTLTDSGVLSIVLICMALVLLGFFMHKRIKRTQFLLLFFLLLLPTTINETKATVILLPAGLLATVIAGSPRGMRLKITAAAATLLALFAAIMIPVYNFMEANNPVVKDRSLIGFFSDEQQFDKYMEAKKAGIGSRTRAARGDALRIPLEYMSREPVRLAFGLGLGNVSHSTLGQNFQGTYYDLFQGFVITSFTIFLLEIGILGTGLVFLLYWLVFTDAIAVAKTDTGVLGPVAVGWIGVVAVMGIAMFYTTTHYFSSLSYLYWYFSGTIAARRMQLAYAAQETGLSGRLRRALG
jgi:hypothetical protein